MPDPRLIVALDLPDADSAGALADRLAPAVSFFKIGLGTLAGGGLDLARRLKREGSRVFLDMKLFDIPATVERAAATLAAGGLDLLTVHGDPPVVAAAAKGARDSGTRILAVTILTSLDRADLDAMLIAPGDLAAIAQERARRALDAGADGLIASPREAAALRALPEARGKLIVTPGIRPADSEAGDQKRTATPAAAIAAGADHIVVGRPVTAAPDPLAAARAILAGL